MLNYTSQSGLMWQMRLLAARLVPNVGSSPLPPPIGEITFHSIADPERYGLPAHPLKQQYPGLTVLNYFMVIEDRFFVERDRVRGVALYANYNGSDLSLSITSENGRNPLSPWDWEGKPGTPTDPTAKPYLEWQDIEVGGKTYPWFNAAIHGWSGWDNKDRGLDWRDGIPESVATMYDRERGRVTQSIMVPYKAQGLGVAEQTVQPEDVQKTYSVLLFFPVPSAAAKAKELANIGQPWHDYHTRTPLAGPSGYYESHKNDLLKGYGSGDKNLILESLGPAKNFGIRTRGDAPSRPMPTPTPTETPTVTADYKMAAGGWIKQHIIPNSFSQLFWSPVPEVLLVCWPISQTRAEQLLSANLSGHRSTF